MRDALVRAGNANVQLGEGLSFGFHFFIADTQEEASFYLDVIQLGAEGIIAGHPEIAVDVFRRNGYYG